ncbi:hypothetical protein [Nesterenkonia sp.]|uniref:hypothetical protein n=1 Tax=Nesterenkonia sp. TaxID=704201 RepID=UPI00262DB770|nr:hypothetical protein [Nesterenkonia sp.]
MGSIWTVRRFAETDGAPWHRDGDVVEAGTAVLPGPEGMVAYEVPDRASADSGS